MHSLSNKTRRKKTTKLRKSEDDLSTDLPPLLPPLPSHYKPSNYEKTYEKNAGILPTKSTANSHHQNEFYSTNETNLEHQNRLLYQKQLSKSVGDNLQQCNNSQNKFSTLDISKNRQLRQCLSSGDLLVGKSHEELLLLLIQLKRNQSNLKHTIEKLNLQMESEDKLSIIEPHKETEHKLNYAQVKELLIETQKQYESQFPLIDLIDNMVRFNSNSKSNLSSTYRYDNYQKSNNDHSMTNSLNNNFNSANAYSISNQNAIKQKRNPIYTSSNSTVETSTPKTIPKSYLTPLEQEQKSANQKQCPINDESDYACESDTNNIESTYTNRSSCTGTGMKTLNDENQSISKQIRNLEIQPMPLLHKRQSGQSNSKTNEQKSSETTNTISSVISSVKQLHKMTTSTNQKQINQKSVNSTSSMLKNVHVQMAEEEMNHMKEQQMLLEAELERVRNMLMNQSLNVSHLDLNDDPSILTTTENHFQAELANIDQEILNLNAKKEKLIQNLKRKEAEKCKQRDRSKDELINATKLMNGNRTHDQLNIDNKLEDGTELFTDDAIFSTVNSLDFDRVLDDGNLSLCTDVVDDLELSKHENEYMNTLKAEYEQNLKQQLEQERKKTEQKEFEQSSSTKSINDVTINDDDETTTTETVYKTLRVKRKYDSSKLMNKQLTFDSGEVLNVVEIKNSLNNGQMIDKTEKQDKTMITDGQQIKSKVSNLPNLLLKQSS